jgi:hypothetical protein
LVRGTFIDRETCKGIPNAVWVDAVDQESVCIRYYYSDHGGHGTTALVFVYGDFVDKQSGGVKLMRPCPGYNFTPSSLNDKASLWSAQYGGPALILACPGALGSSGREASDQHTKREAEIMSRALDQIKLNHELTGFDVVGQSARGTLAIAMVEKRKDVRCAISAAGALSIIEAERILGFQPDTKYLARVFDPIDHVTEIEKRENLRIFILNDPADSVVD